MPEIKFLPINVDTSNISKIQIAITIELKISWVFASLFMCCASFCILSSSLSSSSLIASIEILIFENQLAAS